jgi:hypothetical protein|tara:strand:+ start:416 stop:550 length:135 start_codon:yes stop_codon:yes gene_type:complete
VCARRARAARAPLYIYNIYKNKKIPLIYILSYYINIFLIYIKLL